MLSKEETRSMDKRSLNKEMVHILNDAIYSSLKTIDPPLADDELAIAATVKTANPIFFIFIYLS